jgi:hypothetical protein
MSNCMICGRFTSWRNDHHEFITFYNYHAEDVDERMDSHHARCCGAHCVAMGSCPGVTAQSGVLVA